LVKIAIVLVDPGVEFVSPTAITVPSFFNTRLWYWPEAIVTALLTPNSGDPWPYELFPHPTTCASFSVTTELVTHP